VHEWLAEVPPVSDYRPCEAAVKGTDLSPPAGKEDPVEHDSSLGLCGDL